MVAGVGKLPDYFFFFSGFLREGNHGVTVLNISLSFIVNM